MQTFVKKARYVSQDEGEFKQRTVTPITWLALPAPRTVKVDSLLDVNSPSTVYPSISQCKDT